MEDKEALEMFAIQTGIVNYKNNEIVSIEYSGEDKYIYCPVKELKYIISNTNDKRVKEWYQITIAIRMSTGKTVRPEEVFGNE